MKFHERLAALPPFAGALLGLLLAAGAAAVHLLVLPFPQALALYLLPVILTGWVSGTAWGLFAALAGTAAFAAVGMRIGGGGLVTSHAALDAGAALLAMGSVALLTGALRRDRDRLSRYARTDQLTGMDNMSSFMERAQNEMKRARRSRQPVSIAYIDIDNLKEINDLLGFLHGDRLLKAFAGDLHNHTRSSDVLARLGGDEFVIMFPETGVEQARGAAAKIHKSFQEVAARENCHATLTIGLLTVFNPEIELEAALKQASDLLLQAKGDGGNTVRDGVTG